MNATMPELNTPTPWPYRPGEHLQLQIVQNCHDEPVLKSQTVTVTISRSLDLVPLLRSPTMEVSIGTEGSEFRAVLIVFDRRFGDTIRRVVPDDEDNEPYAKADTTESEAQFQSFVREGKVEPFLDHFKHDREKREHDATEGRLLDWLTPDEYFDDVTDPDGVAKYEAALWQESEESFNEETEAYDRLRDVRGRLIPRMFAHIRVMRDEDVPADLLQSSTASYFETPGVLLEHIPCYSLSDIHIPGPDDPEKCTAIVQSTVDAAHEINRRGIIKKDCQPRHVIVDARSGVPLHINFVDCDCKDKLLGEFWKRNLTWDDLFHDYDEPANVWNYEVEYWGHVRSRDNTGEIGVVARMKLRDKGMELSVKYPNYQEIEERHRSRYQSTGY